MCFVGAALGRQGDGGGTGTTSTPSPEITTTENPTPEVTTEAALDSLATDDSAAACMAGYGAIGVMAVAYALSGAGNVPTPNAPTPNAPTPNAPQPNVPQQPNIPQQPNAPQPPSPVQPPITITMPPRPVFIVPPTTSPRPVRQVQDPFVPFCNPGKLEELRTEMQSLTGSNTGRPLPDRAIPLLEAINFCQVTTKFVVEVSILFALPVFET